MDDPEDRTGGGRRERGGGGGSGGPLSRRRLLKASGGLVGATALAGCSSDEGGLGAVGDTLDETETPLVDPESVEWWVHRNMDAVALDERNDLAEDGGLLMVDLGFDEATERYYAVWHENVWHEDLPGERDWEAHWGLSSSEFGVVWEQLGDDGYRPITQAHYVLDGERTYAGVWIENEHDLEWRSHRNSTEAQFLDRQESYEEDLLPIDVEAYEVADGDDAAVLYASVWVENVDDLEWDLAYDLSTDAYETSLDGWSDGPERLVDLVTYRAGGSQRYAAIAVENTERKAHQGSQARASPSSSKGWWTSRHSSATSFRNAFGDLTDRGYRPISLSIDGTAPERTHAAVWRQNAHRLVDPLTDELDTALADYLVEGDTDADSETDIDLPLPNVSAAVIVDGEFVYRRGFGYGDVDDGRWVDSRTVYRLASVSKTVGGVLGVALRRAGVLELDDETHEHVDGMDEDDHEYTLEHLLRHQACVPHYSESAVSSREKDSYDTAHEAAAAFDYWTDELLVDIVADPDEPGEVDDDDVSPLFTLGPGDSCTIGDVYRYSTPGFTLLGAAYEGATDGTPVADLVTETVSDPLGLDSFRAEDRTVTGIDTETGRLQRARVYEWDDDAEENALVDESDVDDLSWKVLGGGLESSVSDLALLGQAVLEADGGLLDEDDRDDLRDTDIAGYGLGWRAGREIVDGDLHDVMYHGGSQLGGNSELRVYPDDDVVVSVLSSRKAEDDQDEDDATEVAKTLAEIVL